MSAHLSIVIPVFNEEKRIVNIEKITAYVKNLPYVTELLIVDDGSTDKTLEILNSYSKSHNLKILSYARNKGKGHAVKKGMIAATGRYVLFMDIDLSTPLYEIPRIVAKMRDCDVCIATRKSSDAKLVKRQPFIRESMGKGFTLLTKLMLGVPVSDFTCGFKCFTSDSAQTVFRQVTVDGWSFDAQSLALAHRAGLKIAELPVEWADSPGTRVNLLKDIMKSFIDLVQIRKSLP